MGGEKNKAAAALLKKIAGLHAAISKLPSLSPSPEVDALFTALVAACARSTAAVDVAALGPRARRMRCELVRLCADAEARLEAHCSDALAALAAPLDHLRLFPYHDNYARLAELEHALLSLHAPDRLAAAPARVAFLGSGSLPLGALLLAARHMPDAAVDCFDRCGAANDRARRLLLRGGDDDGGVAARMSFRTADVVEDLTHELAAYDVVFLAAPVGVTPEEKTRVMAHLGRHMADGAALVVRSAHGARGFLCPVVEPAEVGRAGFQVLAVHHPGEMINSVIVARKVPEGCLELVPPAVSPPCNCCEVVEKARGRLPPTSCHLDAMDEIRRRAW